MIKRWSLAWRILSAILLTTLIISAAATFMSARVNWRSLEAEQLRSMEDYVFERAQSTEDVFEAIRISHQAALRSFSLQIDTLTDQEIDEQFDRFFPLQNDGTRRSHDGLFEGYTDEYGYTHHGVGAFLNSPSGYDTDHKRLILTAYQIVDRGGEMLNGLVDNLYFSTNQNELIISAANRADSLLFYRRDATADFNFYTSPVYTSVQPEVNPDGVFSCAGLSRLIYVQNREALTTACYTPLRVNGEHLGAFGTTIQLESHFQEAMTGAPQNGENILMDQDGNLIVHIELLEGEITEVEVARLSDRLALGELRNTIANSELRHGTTVSEDGGWFVAYAYLPGPDWYFATFVDQTYMRAEIFRSTAMILLVGLFGVIVQALIIYVLLFRLVIRPVKSLTNRYGELSRDKDDSDPTLIASMQQAHELGDLARTLERQRQENSEHLDTLEKRVADRTAELEKANQAIGDFLANMSHELRTPLNGILGLAQVIESSTDDKTINNQARLIYSSGKSLTLLLNDVLDMSKIEAGMMELAPIHANVHQLLLEIQALFHENAKQKGLELILQLDDDLPEFGILDPLRVKQCLTNLVSNAIKFTDSGSVTIQAGAEKSDNSYLMTIAVIDTGIGMHAETMDRLFSAFTQAESSTASRFGGTGLGLSIARKLARLMGGDVSATSTPGQGSSFTLTFAMAAGNPETETGNNTDAEFLPHDPRYASLQGLKILLVEDNYINRQVVLAFLKPLNPEIMEAYDGFQALERIEKDEFDLVLMDINMPGMTGYEVSQKIRDGGNITPVIALTANTNEDMGKLCRQAGMDTHLSKPLERDQLIKAMLQVLEGRDKT